MSSAFFYLVPCHCVLLFYLSGEFYDSPRVMALVACGTFDWAQVSGVSDPGEHETRPQYFKNVL